MDDLHLVSRPVFRENIDYMTKRHILPLQLHVCWKENNLTKVKSASDDISWQIPSTNSKRLENISWRRWYKDLLCLGEVAPSEINWDKCHDITWLYGPKYIVEGEFSIKEATREEFCKKDTSSCVFDSDNELVSSVQLGASLMTFELEDEESEQEEESDEEEDEQVFELRLALRSAHAHSSPRPRRLVKFNYIVNSREFVNGMSFDYDFLDPSIL
uniref:Uncharacterized protein n=1 Tax=Candidozyma auris TaxID=498019 RepID=A0A0L0P1R8_CANAR